MTWPKNIAPPMVLAVRLFILISCIVMYYGGSYKGYQKGYIDGENNATTNFVIPKQKIIEVEVPVQPKGVILSLTIADLKQDLKNYSHMPDVVRELILTSIAQAADKYKVHPLIIHAMIHSESSFRWWIIHGKKDDKDRAVGLGAIRYGLWGEKLKKAGIIKSRNDLFDITKNINATAFVFAHERTKPLKAGTTDPNVSAMRRYFGDNHKWYSDKVEAKIFSIISKKVYK